MYLTDYRERTLKDVITQLEPGLFKKVTGLDVKDFEMLCTIGVFNASLMNDAIFKFKRYEDSSLSYTGIDVHEGKAVGGWDTVIKRDEYEKLFYNQQATMEAPTITQVIETGIPKPEPKPVEKKAKTPAQPQHRSVVSQYQKPAATPISPSPEKKAEVIEIDVSKIVPGATVIHKAFGKGTIANVDKAQKHMRVKFAVGEKNFIFPDAFTKGYLRME